MTQPNAIDKPSLDSSQETATDNAVLSKFDDITLDPSSLPQTKKKDNVNAWLLTLILHVLIACSLIGYWYFYQHPKTTQNLQIDLASKKTITQSAILPSSTATLTTLSSVAASTAMSAAVASAPSTAVSSDASRPLANYVAKNQTALVTVPAPSQAPTISKKVIVHEAPVTKALTDRDIPNKEIGKAETVQTVNQEKASKKTPSTSESEAAKLSKDIDVDNAELTKLIEQVKTQNQQKIDAATKSDTADTVATPAEPIKPAKESETVKETKIKETKIKETKTSKDTKPVIESKSTSKPINKPVVIDTPAEVTPVSTENKLS